jgi:hypothetical protein
VLAQLAKHHQKISFTLLLINTIAYFWFNKITNPAFNLSSLPNVILILLLAHSGYSIFRARNSEANSIITFFLVFTNAYYILQVLSMPAWLSLIAISLATFFVFMGNFENKDWNEKHALFGIALSLATAEVFLVLSYWPVDVLTRSAVGSIFFYLVWHFSADYLQKTLSKQITIQFITYGLLATLLIILTGTWYTG